MARRRKARKMHSRLKRRWKQLTPREVNQRIEALRKAKVT